MRIIISLVLAVASTSATADTFKFCFEPWIPYGTRSEKGESSGSTVEFYQAVFKKMGHEITFLQLPPERCWDSVKDGSIDGMLFTTASAVPGVLDSKIVTEYWMLAALVPETSKEKKFSRLAQFKGKSVGVTKGYDYPENLAKWEGLKPEETTDSLNSLRKIANGRIDVMFDDPLWAELKAKEEPLKFRSLMPLAAAMPCIGAFAAKHAALLKKFEETANALIKEGVLDKLYVKSTGLTFKAFKKKYGIK